MSESNNLDDIIVDDLEPISIKVTVNPKPGGKPRSFILREADADAARVYGNCITQAARFKGDPKKDTFGVSHLEGANDAETLLVSRCLFEGDKLVPLAELKKWKSKVVAMLFDRIKKISDLDKKDAAELAKNGQEPAGDTSQPQTGSEEPSASTSAGAA